MTLPDLKKKKKKSCKWGLKGRFGDELFGDELFTWALQCHDKYAYKRETEGEQIHREEEVAA